MLGQGGYGRVYDAVHQGRQVACKVGPINADVELSFALALVSKLCSPQQYVKCIGVECLQHTCAAVIERPSDTRTQNFNVWQVSMTLSADDGHPVQSGYPRDNHCC